MFSIGITLADIFSGKEMLRKCLFCKIVPIFVIFDLRPNKDIQIIKVKEKVYQLLLRNNVIH